MKNLGKIHWILKKKFKIDASIVYNNALYVYVKNLDNIKVEEIKKFLHELEIKKDMPIHIINEKPELSEAPNFILLKSKNGKLYKIEIDDSVSPPKIVISNVHES